MEEITLDTLRQALPAKLRSSTTQELVDKLNAITTDPVVANSIKDNFVSYTSVLADGKYKTEDYLSAVAYVSFKLMGYSNKEAYLRTFPDRYSSLLASGKTEKDISAYVSAFSRGKLVNAILEQSLVPSWVLNQDVYQEAINKQVELMRTARSERVQMMAADSLLKNLQKPEAAGPLINIDMREGSGLDELRQAVTSLAQTQKDLIQSGTSIRDITNQKIFVEDV